MKRENKYGLKSLRRDFPTDQACLEFAFDTLHSRECSCGGKYTPVKGRKQFYCTRCRKQVAVLVGTIFERSVVGLLIWFRAMFLVHEGIGVKALQREIGTTYKTAWRVRSILRNAMRGDTIDIICPKKPTVLGIKKTEKKLLPVLQNGKKKTRNAIENTKETNTQSLGLRFFLGTAEQYQNAFAAEKDKSSFWHLTTLRDGKGKKGLRALRGIGNYSKTK